jgi:hypothetical protein
LRAARDEPGTKLRARQALLDAVDRRHVEDLSWLAENYGVKLIEADELSRLESEAPPAVEDVRLVDQILESFDPEKVRSLAALTMHRLASGAS